MSRPPMLRLALAAALLAAACSSPCFQIQQTLCLCQGLTQTERTNCEDAASAQEQLATESAAQLSVCQSLLPQCAKLIGPNGEGCDKLQTAAGRRTCGLSK